jgi:hypothetical protein
MAVLTISAASAAVSKYPTWWEDMNAGETYTAGSYSTISAWVDPDPGTGALQTHGAVTDYNVASGNNVIDMSATINTKLSGDEDGVYRQLVSQTGKAAVQTGTPLKYDAENPEVAVTKAATFEQSQLALFSGDLDCPTKVFGATFENDVKVGVSGTGGMFLNEKTLGKDYAQVEGKGNNVNIIEAYAGQYSSGELLEIQESERGEGVETEHWMSGEAGLYAGFDDAVVGAAGTGDNVNTITVQMGNTGVTTTTPGYNDPWWPYTYHPGTTTTTPGGDVFSWTQPVA